MQKISRIQQFCKKDKSDLYTETAAANNLKADKWEKHGV